MTTSSADRTPATIYPGLTYRDAPAMIDWLERAFGFQRRLVVPADGREVRHAELTLGDAVIMVNSPRTDLKLASPRDLGGAHAGVCCYVAEPDAHHDRAVREGAEVVFPLNDTSHGSREYTARDPEGVMWTFGTYRPGAYWDGKQGA
jgi:uncharacterized glyoxalase superfamily protein PhnB